MNTTARPTNDTSNTALVLGVTGGYGGAIAAELLRRGWQVRALVRDKERGQRAVADLPGTVELFEGDLHASAVLKQAARGVSAIVHGVNAPYDQWPTTVVPYAQIIADLAVTERATVLFPGNIYNFAPALDIDETTAPQAPTAKGELRIAAEEVLSEATTRGARLITLRGGDFYGMGHDSSWMAHMLKDVAKPKRSIQMPSEPDVPHQWCFLPDFVATHVDLLERGQTLEADASFHFAGHVATGTELTSALRQALNQPARKFSAVPWWLLRVVGVFQPVMREVVGMRYLWQQAVVMRQDKLEATLPVVPHTPLVTALRRELRHWGLGAAV